MTKPIRIQLTSEQRQSLEHFARCGSNPAGLVRRVQVILWSDQGIKGREIARRLNLTPEHVSKVRARFEAEKGIESLRDLPKAGRKDHAVPAEVVERILQTCMSPPPAGRSRWTTRLLGKHFGLTSGCISDILSKHGLKPHLVRTYKVSKDPKFEAKVQDVVGLYLNPPEHAVVLSVDEKTSIQALERTQLPLPLRTGRAARHTHDYKRHGVVDLYAALEVATGRVTHKTTDSHKAQDFLGFMNLVVQQYPQQELHVILDNSSTHNTAAVRDWLACHTRVRFHFTPTSASWLNQVEGWFGILGKQSLARTDFKGKQPLRKHLAAYADQWNQSPTPFVWTKPAEAIIRSRRRMLERISTAMH
jgi:transposase